jgi:hypothetical protein
MKEVRTLKEWECVVAYDHKDIGKNIKEMQKNGWIFHTYQVAGTPSAASHYLLFEKGT